MLSLFSALTLFSRYKDSLGSGHSSELKELSELTSQITSIHHHLLLNLGIHGYYLALVTKFSYIYTLEHCIIQKAEIQFENV